MNSIPGLDDHNIETWVNESGEHKATSNGRCVPFGMLPLEILRKLSISMLADTVAVESMQNDLHITDPQEQLDKYYRCCSPIVDEIPDLDICTCEIHKELWDCPSRSECPAFGKVCKAVTGANGILTKQETNIFYMSCQGLLDKEIADRLGCSINTVDTHQKRIKKKLCLNNRVEYLLFIRPQQFKQYEHKK